MKLTPAQLREYASAVEAAMNDQPVEYWDEASQRWVLEKYIPDIWTTTPHRPKPAPKTRPWSHNDIPALCWIAPLMENGNRGLETMIIAVGAWYVSVYSCFEECKIVDFKDLHKYVYSTDRKTWHKCEVQEES